MHETFDKIDQVGRTINQITRCVRDHKVSRSILINVHHPKVDSRNALGLNTIHFTIEAPDRDPDKWLLHASYIWRTVDVLAGLPFNMHGAANFLCHVVARCNERLSAHQASRLEAGQMIIVALNLHLYEGLDCLIAEQLVRRSIDTTEQA